MKFSPFALLSSLSFALSASAGGHSHGHIPSGAITVGTGGKYPNLTVALGDTSSNIFYVFAGNYTGQTLINRPNVTIYGETTTPLSYLGNKVTLSVNMPASIAGSNDKSGTVRVNATGVKLYNLDIENTYGLPVSQSQAIALSVQAGNFGCYFCDLRGHQDTLLANRGYQVYAYSRILGSVDFIFGMYASIWITKSVVESDISPLRVVIAVIQTGNAKNQTYFGRPWRASARVVFQKSFIGDNVYPAGWSQWQATDPRTDYILFGEYGNFGPGAWKATARAPFATLLNASISIETVLGSNYTTWVDRRYI
ncbi:related to pectinesterase EC=3.1.1.11-Cochliobolus carbonum [Serendipita indica DSM 11827]|uniref:Pectinesterase n=1 Tax=Serendipita indica (strain DSM 11827) TaxID=1109443 RepID=G4THK6_SERID|nr:related to pectinesterase EC=3.1.1.11-Cochliobolus carbonum [Serendipita indica DSM 11827]